MNHAINTDVRSPNFYTPAHIIDQLGHWAGFRWWEIHKTEGTFPSDRNYLCNPDLPAPVSANFYIHQDGQIDELVPLTVGAAWHGWVRPAWRKPLYMQMLTPFPQKNGDWNANFHFAGVELSCLRGHPHTAEQEAALIWLILNQRPKMAKQFALDREHIFGHYEFNTHKVDPMPWDWDDFMAKLTLAAK